MDRPLLLVAASGLAKEVVAAVREHGGHRLVGILDDEPSLHGTSLSGLGILGPLDAVVDHPDADLLVCVGSGRGRSRVVERLSAIGVTDDRYATVVHPASPVGVSNRVGVGSILLAQVVLTTDVSVGRHVVVMPHVTMTHDDVVADFATLCAGVRLGGSVRIEPRAYLGMNASVRERVLVGCDAVLGMGSVLLTDLPDGQTWAGIPARPLHSTHAEESRLR